MRPVLRRVGSGVVVVWAAITLTFLALQLAPGSTIDALIGEGPDTPAIREQIATEWGLDHPLIVQYLDYLARLGHGDLGRSYNLERSVSEVVGNQLMPTVELTATAVLLALVFATAVAVATAGRSRWVRGASSGAELVLVSTPSFWLGIVLLTVFSFGLGWLEFSSLWLPAITLALPIGSMLAQVLREGIERALEQPFALTARARGISRTALVARHALPHALLPAVTLSGWVIGGLLGGAVVTEQVFGRAGLGQVTLTAVNGQDMPVVLAVVVLAAVVFVVVSTVVDVAYLVIDPRLRSG